MCLGISVFWAQLGDDVGVFPGSSHGCLRACCLAELYVKTKPPSQIGVGIPHLSISGSNANTDLIDPLKLSSFFFRPWIAAALLAEERRGDLQKAAF